MTRATRRQQIDALTRLPQRANIVEDIIEVADPETPGKILLRKQGRRADNVFESIFTSGRIDSETRHAAHQLCEVYAKSKGVFNVTERSMERVQYESSDLHEQMMIRASYAMQYHEIMDRLESNDGKLIAALVKDFVLGDGSRAVLGKPSGISISHETETVKTWTPYAWTDKPHPVHGSMGGWEEAERSAGKEVIADHGVRWRKVVRDTCAKHGIPCRRTYEGAPVAYALRDLPWATIDYRKMSARLMDERRKLQEQNGVTT